jgi:hypothetical protein
MPLMRQTSGEARGVTHTVVDDNARNASISAENGADLIAVHFRRQLLDLELSAHLDQRFASEVGSAVVVIGLIATKRVVWLIPRIHCL